jgi:hypothetical protein
MVPSKNAAMMASFGLLVPGIGPSDRGFEKKIFPNTDSNRPRERPMSPRCLIALAACALLMAGAGAARAATAVRLQTVGALPFSGEEIEQAAGARLAMSAEPDAPVVVVGPEEDAGILLQLGDQRAVVPVGGRSGLPAARIVALAIAELAAAAPDEPPPAEPEVATAPPEGDKRDGPPAIAVPAAPAPPAPPGPPARISIALGGAKGMTAAEPLTWTFEGDVALPLRAFDLVAGLGVWNVPTRNAGWTDEASFFAGVLRAGAGWRGGPAELVLGPFVAPYRIEGAVQHTGVLAGGGAMLRMGWRLTTAAKVQLFGSLRVDAFANRVSVSVEGQDPSFVSPRLSVAGSIGVGWDLGS